MKMIFKPTYRPALDGTMILYKYDGFDEQFYLRAKGAPHKTPITLNVATALFWERFNEIRENGDYAGAGEFLSRDMIAWLTEQGFHIAFDGTEFYWGSDTEV
jgi:hypothetical protein